MPDGSIHAERDASAMSSQAAQPGATILAGHFLAAVRRAAAATERRNTIPILGNLRLEVRDGSMLVQGTDMEAEMATTAPAAGSLAPVTLSARTLAELLRHLRPEEEVFIAASSADRELGRVSLKAGPITLRPLTLPAEDFPALKPWKPVTRFAIEAADLRRMLGLVSFAISTEETRYYLNGVLLHTRPGPNGQPLLKLVATDGHRLSMAEVPLPAGAEGLADIIVPRKAVTQLAGLLGAKGSISVEVGTSHIRFGSRDWTLTTKAIDGTYPDYQRVFPRFDTPPRVLTVKLPGELRRILAAATAMSEEWSRPVKLTAKGMTASPLKISAASGEGGTSDAVVPRDVAEWGTGHGIEIGLQARYLEVMTRALPAPLTFSFVDGGSPVRIDFKGGAALLMPMRV